MSASRKLAAIGALALLVALPGAALANHSWGSYHWARTSNPFTLKLGNNLSSTWSPILGTASGDWSASSVLDTTIVAGQSASRKKCIATSGRVEVCNGAYGKIGWLGIATIWASGGHIFQGTVQVNDTYFNSRTYNTTAWRTFVMCQEVGHTFGLEHQDEDHGNANLGTCMDYTNSPDTNQHPNQGDYDQLLCIYDPASAGATLTTSTHSCTGTGHLDSTSTLSSLTPSGAAPFGLAVATSKDGRTTTFVWQIGTGLRIITHVIWA